VSYRGTARDVTLAADMNGWDPARDPLTRVADTDLFFLSLQFPADARLDYKLVSDGQWLLDPLNPRTILGGYGPNSQAMMPRYVPPPEIERYADIRSARSAASRTAASPRSPLRFTGRTCSATAWRNPVAAWRTR
jgi:hypothetical protein